MFNLVRNSSKRFVQLPVISRNLSLSKSLSAETKKVKDDRPKQSSPEQKLSSVPGLSSKVLNVPSTETGPGASKSATYKNPEYFCYHATSYFDAEIEMAKYRLPQPSARTK